MGQRMENALVVPRHVLPVLDLPKTSASHAPPPSSMSLTSDFVYTLVLLATMQVRNEREKACGCVIMSVYTHHCKQANPSKNKL